MVSKDWEVPLAFAVGLLVGCGLTFGSLVLFTWIGGMLANVYPLNPAQEFGMSGGEAWLFICVGVGLVLGGVAVFRQKMPATTRAFLVGCAIPLFGFWALCSLISGSSLFQPHSALVGPP